jgi:predicted transcriptional regulator YheO
MNSEQKEKYLNVINTAGIQTVLKLYHLLGDERISMATLRKLIFKQEVAKSLDGKLPVKKLAKKLKVSHTTLYRYLKKK